MNIVRPSPKTYRRLADKIGRAPGCISSSHASGPVNLGAHSAPIDAPDLPVGTGRGHVPRPFSDKAFQSDAPRRDRALLRAVFLLFWLAGVATGLWIALGAAWMSAMSEWVQ